MQCLDQQLDDESALLLFGERTVNRVSRALVVWTTGEWEWEVLSGLEVDLNIPAPCILRDSRQDGKGLQQGWQ
jgi:hypothetical protein